MNKIKRAQFILMVVNHFEKKSGGANEWYIDDSFVHIAEELDLADIDHETYNKLLADCRFNADHYLDLEW